MLAVPDVQQRPISDFLTLKAGSGPILVPDSGSFAETAIDSQPSAAGSGLLVEAASDGACLQSLRAAPASSSALSAEPMDPEQWLAMSRGVQNWPPPPDACEEDLATIYKQMAEQYAKHSDYKVRDTYMAYMQMAENMILEIKNKNRTLIATRRADLERPLLTNDDEPTELSPEDDETNKAKTDEAPVTLSPKDPVLSSTPTHFEECTEDAQQHNREDTQEPTPRTPPVRSSYSPRSPEPAAGGPGMFVESTSGPGLPAASSDGSGLLAVAADGTPPVRSPKGPRSPEPAAGGPGLLVESTSGPGLPAAPSDGSGVLAVAADEYALIHVDGQAELDEEPAKPGEEPADGEEQANLGMNGEEPATGGEPKEVADAGDESKEVADAGGEPTEVADACEPKEDADNDHESSDCSSDSDDGDESKEVADGGDEPSVDASSSDAESSSSSSSSGKKTKKKKKHKGSKKHKSSKKHKGKGRTPKTPLPTPKAKAKALAQAGKEANAAAKEMMVVARAKAKAAAQSLKDAKTALKSKETELLEMKNKCRSFRKRHPESEFTKDFQALGGTLGSKGKLKQKETEELLKKWVAEVHPAKLHLIVESIDESSKSTQELDTKLNWVQLCCKHSWDPVDKDAEVKVERLMRVGAITREKIPVAQHAAWIAEGYRDTTT